MKPETAAALAAAGYQLSVDTSDDPGSMVPEPGVDQASLPPPTRVFEPGSKPMSTIPGSVSEPIPDPGSLDQTETQTGDTGEAGDSPAFEGTREQTIGEETLSEETPPDEPGPIGKTSLFKVLLARETLPHFGILALLMFIFLFIRFSADEDLGDILIVLSLGGMLAYALAGILALTSFVNLLRHPRYGWGVPLLLTIVLSILIRYVLLVDTENKEENRELLGLSLVGLFLLWQFLQAWWMRIPFEDWALRRFAPDESGPVDMDWEGPSSTIDRFATKMAGKGPYLNAVAPIIWAVIGLGLFELLYHLDIFIPEEGAFFSEFDMTFRIAWLAGMILVGTLWTLLVRRMLRWAPESGRVALFSGAFAFGYWVFLAYHGFALFWSLAQEPSFVFDLLFMLITILVAIYSLSSRAIHAAGGLVQPQNVLFFGIAFGISYSGANFFLISDFGGGFDPRTVGYLSHLIAGLFGALVLLLVNVTFLKTEGHLRHGGLRGLRQALKQAPVSGKEDGDSPTPEPEGAGLGSDTREPVTRESGSTTEPETITRDDEPEEVS